MSQTTLKAAFVLAAGYYLLTWQGPIIDWLWRGGFFFVGMSIFMAWATWHWIGSMVEYSRDKRR